jgi:AcrR family transcriptional regulator
MSRGEQTRDAILARATAEAARVGLGALSIGTLSKAMGMSKSGVFAHFRSKEALQVQIIEHGAARFTDSVIRPALKAPRGEPRVRALFEGWLRWLEIDHRDNGCLFVAAAAELDDQAGPARRQLVAQQRDLLELIAGVVSTAIKQGDFRGDLDAEQMAFEAHAIVLAYHHASRLMCDADAAHRARTAFDRLVADARAS